MKINLGCLAQWIFSMNNKKISRTTGLKKQEADVARYMQEVRAMDATGITRRDLFKMGLTTGIGGLVAIGGSSFIPNLARANSNIMISPANKPWQDDLPIPKICQSTAITMGGLRGQPGKNPIIDPNKEIFTQANATLQGTSFAKYSDARQESHQLWNELKGSEAIKYELQAKETQWNYYSNNDPSTAGLYSTIWTYFDLHSDAIGLLKIQAQYGQSTLLRLYNNLPPTGSDTQGFGLNEANIHLHNGHTAPESDGGPYENRELQVGQFYDYHWANRRAGFNGTHIKSSYTDKQGKQWDCQGDWKETQSSLWWHDHTDEATAQNVVKGLVSFYSLFSHDINLDTGDEQTGLRLPSGKYDIPLAITDRVFDASGEVFLDTFVTAGYLGDKQTVNLKIQPKLLVDRRKYRFRILSGGPARVLQVFVKYNGQVQPITRIGTDGNLLPKALLVNSMRMSPAERADIIIDFSQYPKGAEIYLENCLEQLKEEAPKTNILPSSDKTRLLKFIVGDYTDDYSGGEFPGTPDVVRKLQLKNLQTQTMLLTPDVFPKPVKERRFSFGKGNGVWNVNGQLFDHDEIIAYPIEGTAEHWTFKSGGGWIHPVHHHHTEGLILSRDGKAPQPDERCRKDAYRIGDAALEDGGSSSVTVEIKFRDWLGKYPLHCHNTMHEDAGMMFNFEIVKSDNPNAGK
jgi:FtsP/CotA-like multicopper oxidase with cupredoxin domain